MTIITGKHEEKKDHEDVKKELNFVPVVVTEKTPAVPLTRPSLAWSSPSVSELHAAEWYRNWRRRRVLTSLCVALLVLWLMLAALLGGYLLFRHLHRRPTYYGWCGVKYTDRDNGGHPHYEKLQERVEVDPDEEYEKIEVPRFGPNRPAVFVHDFRKNLTGIADLVGNQCFIKHLDRNRIAPPVSFMDLIKKMEEGYYEQTAGVVKEEFRVRLPPLTLSELWDMDSKMIYQQCQDKVSYMMDKVDRRNKRKRNKRHNGRCFEFEHITAKDKVPLVVKEKICLS